MKHFKLEFGQDVFYDCECHTVSAKFCGYDENDKSKIITYIIEDKILDQVHAKNVFLTYAEAEKDMIKGRIKSIYTYLREENQRNKRILYWADELQETEEKILKYLV